MKGGISLPTEEGDTVEWEPSGLTAPPSPAERFTSRLAYAAAHVVADPEDPARLDWDATLAFRRHLWRHGFGVAEAMDTAQRGKGLDWRLARELITRTAAEARAFDQARAVYGVSTDQLEGGLAFSRNQVVAAYLEQLEVVEEAESQAILMASRALVEGSASSEDYLEVYAQVIDRAGQPVLIHWLGEAFDPALAGYWGDPDPRKAAETVIELARRHPDRIEGVKLSLLDHDLELHLRRQLPPGVRIFTGDDFNFLDLILGDEDGYSDALLGVLDPIAPIAAQAFLALDRGKTEAYRSLLEPTVPFARHLFAPPTYHYKTGITFLGYLNGHQDHFRMLAGAETARSLPHLAQLLVLADQARLLVDPELAVNRARPVLEGAV